MSYSGLPALEINPLRFGEEQNLLTAQRQQVQGAVARQAQDATEQDQRIRSQEQELQQRSQLAPLALKSAQNKSKLEDLATANTLIAEAARAAQAADPQDAPDIWDKGMQTAKEAGAVGADQYIGHYRADLAERVGDLYGAPASGQGGSPRQTAAGATQDQQAIERAVASMPPPKLQQALGNLDRVITAFNGVRDKQTWDENLQTLKDSGVDITQFLPSTEWNPINYAAAARVVKSLTPTRDAMAARSTLLAAGATPPAPPPQGTSQYIGTERDTQKPIYYNSTTGQEKVGERPIGAKPTAATSVFQKKYDMAVQSGMSQDEALQFANGRKAMAPERMQQIAQDQANREYQNQTFAGVTIPNPDEWIRAKAAENLQMLSASAAPVGPAPGAGGPNPKNKYALPQRAIDTLKKANGGTVTFNNGLKFKWDPKTNQPVPVQ